MFCRLAKKVSRALMTFDDLLGRLLSPILRFFGRHAIQRTKIVGLAEVGLNIRSSCNPGEHARRFKPLAPSFCLFLVHEVAIAMQQRLDLELAVDEQTLQELVAGQVFYSEAPT